MSKLFEGILEEDKQELADKMRSEFEFNNGVVTEKEKGSAVKSILSPEEHKTLMDGLEIQHRVEETWNHAIVQEAAERFLEDKDLDKVTGKVALGRGTLQGTFNPRRVHTVSIDKEKGPYEVTKFLNGNTKITGGSHRGMKKWREAMSNAFQKEYEK